ncbi:MAG: hypothetical protein V3U92_12310 [Cellulophaga sp.]
MKKLLPIGFGILFLIACSGVKKTQESLNVGDYSTAINNAVRSLSGNKTKKRNQPYILLLEEVFKKNAEREMQHIAFLQKEGSPANLEAIYTNYVNLKRVQEQIKPLLPLHIIEENRQAEFSFINYNDNIIASKNKLSDYLYANAQKLMKNATKKIDYRVVFDDLKYLNGIDPNKGNTINLMKEAHEKGINYVRVSLANNSQQIIPSRLEEDLLDFGTYDLDKFWTQYHTNPDTNKNYDFDMYVSFDQINVSPERIQEKEVTQIKEVKDGYTYARNTEGGIAVDSLGNKIKIPVLRKAKCTLYQFMQNKEVQISATVKFKDLKTKQLLDSYPLASTFVFEHGFATYKGDVLALEDNFLRLTRNKEVPFPSNEQMVFDAGEDLKLKLKNILTRHSF